MDWGMGSVGMGRDGSRGASRWGGLFLRRVGESKAARARVVAAAVEMWSSWMLLVGVWWFWRGEEEEDGCLVGKVVSTGPVELSSGASRVVVVEEVVVVVGEEIHRARTGRR